MTRPHSLEAFKAGDFDIVRAGVTCPTVDAAKVRSTILAIDLILGRDRFAQRYIKDYRQRQADSAG